MQIWHQHVVSLDLDIHQHLSPVARPGGAWAWTKGRMARRIVVPFHQVSQQSSANTLSCQLATSATALQPGQKHASRCWETATPSNIHQSLGVTSEIWLYTVSSHWPQGLARPRIVDTLSWINGSPSTSTWSLYAMVAGGQGGIMNTVVIIFIPIIIAGSI